MKSLMIGTALMIVTASTALAGPAMEKAKARIAAIAAGDTVTVSKEYADGATLHWIGGPLDGTYRGSDIAAVWGKFAKAQPKLTAEATDVVEAMNPKGATITANVIFDGKDKIPVRYVLVYRDGKLTDEIWQVDPALLN
jgi:hypothetical protein